MADSLSDRCSVEVIAAQRNGSRQRGSPRSRLDVEAATQRAEPLLHGGNADADRLAGIEVLVRQDGHAPSEVANLQDDSLGRLVYAHHSA